MWTSTTTYCCKGLKDGDKKSDAGASDGSGSWPWREWTGGESESRRVEEGTPHASDSPPGLHPVFFDIKGFVCKAGNWIDKRARVFLLLALTNMCTLQL